MRKHPGILFTLYTSLLTIFLVYLLEYFAVPHITKDSIKILWGGWVIYGITYYHGKWVESLFKRYP